MRRILYVFFISLLSMFFFLKPGMAEEVKIQPVEFTTAFSMGNEDIEEQLLQYPTEVHVSGGFIYILDTKGCSVQKYDKDGRFLLTFGGRGSGPQELLLPASLIISQNKIYIANSKNARIEIFDLEGGYIGSFKLENEPSIILADGTGNLLINFAKKNLLVHKYTPSGKYVQSFVPSSTEKNQMLQMFYDMIYITMGDHDELWVIYRFQNKIEKYSPDGKLIFACQRPLTAPYETLRPYTNKDGSTQLQAKTLSAMGSYFNDILYVITQQGGTENSGTLIDKIDGRTGKYLGSFKLNFNCLFIHVESPETIFAIEKDESRVHKLVLKKDTTQNSGF